jgi:aminoglycoside/choline kinase family phosphotransferase
MPLSKTSEGLICDIRAEAAGIFPHRTVLSVEPMPGGGSERQFFRVTFDDHSTLVAVCFGNERPENAIYGRVAQFLRNANVPVPQLFSESSERLWLEDLGGTDLWSLRERPWQERSKPCKDALAAVAQLHRISESTLEKSQLPPNPVFDERLYLWEQNYFFEHALGGVFHMPQKETDALAASLPLGEIASRLATLPRVCVHRDFQSQNVMIHNERAVLIDFQGLRPGLGAYDLASFLYDPYVSFTEDERNELLEHYLQCGGQTYSEQPYSEVLDLCAMQRLMQALGAYGNLGLRHGKTRFLEYVAPAANRLAGIARRIPGMEPLASLLRELPPPNLPTH